MNAMTIIALCMISGMAWCEYHLLINNKYKTEVTCQLIASKCIGNVDFYPDWLTSKGGRKTQYKEKMKIAPNKVGRIVVDTGSTINPGGYFEGYKGSAGEDAFNCPSWNTEFIINCGGSELWIAKTLRVGGPWKAAGFPPSNYRRHNNNTGVLDFK